VVDIDHTYVSAATRFPDRVVTAQEATTNFDVPEPAQPITQIMADDGRFVIDQLAELNDTDPQLRGKLNLDAIGVIGHSVGGAMAYNMAINDKRVKAAIDLDGVVYVTPTDSDSMAPFLMLAGDGDHVRAIENNESLMKRVESSMGGAPGPSDDKHIEGLAVAERNAQGLGRVLRASGNAYTIVGSDHMKFTDIGLFIGSGRLRELMQIRGTTAPARCLEITQALSAAFFDSILKGQPVAGLDSLTVRYPELKKVRIQ
jgi:hypothetical protein